MMALGPITARPRKNPRRRPSLRPRPELLEDRLAPAAGGALAGLGGPYYLENVFGVEPPDGDYALGGAVAISGDGQTVAVASRAALDLENGPVDGQYFFGAGSVSVYSNDGQGWIRTAEIPFLDPGDTEFLQTRDVLLSEDGDRIVVAVGVAYTKTTLTLHVLDRSGDEWIETHVVDVPGAGGYSSIAMSGDGRAVAIGEASGGDPASRGPGLVRIYAETDGAWDLSAELKSPTLIQDDRYGRSVSLSGDGRTLVVTANAQRVDPYLQPGVAYIYEDSGAGWEITTQLVIPGDRAFGETSAISRDGGRVLLFGLGPGDSGPYSAGLVHVYARDGSGWRHEAELVSPKPGLIVDLPLAIDEDGDTAVFRTEDRTTRMGSVQVYRRSGATWQHVQTLADPEPDERYPWFGRALAVHEGLVVVGSESKVINGVSGSVFFFEEPRSLTIVAEPSDLTGRPATVVTFTAQAVGAETIATQWQVSDDGGATWVDVPQATSPWLSFIPTLADSGKLYRAAFSDGEGTTLTTRAATLTVAEATPIVTIDPGAGPVYFYDRLTLTVHVRSDGSTPIVPEGGVLELTIGQETASARVSGGVATFTFTAGAFRPGQYAVTARYDGADDPVFASASAVATQPILRATTTVAVLPLRDPRYALSPTIVAAAVTADQPRDLRDRGVNGVLVFYGLGAYPGAAPLLSSSDSYVAGRYPITFDRPGEYSVVAYYSGDAWHEPSISEPFRITVAPAPVKVSVDPYPVNFIEFGDPADKVITVQGLDGTPAKGRVRVTITGPGQSGSRERLLDRWGVTRVSLSSLAPGAHLISMRFFDPDGVYADAEFVTGVGVYMAPTSVTIQSSRTTSAAGETVLFEATARRAGAEYRAFGGTMQFYVGTQLVATSPIDDVGRARLATSALVPGVYTITAVYQGSDFFQPSMPAQMIHQVLPSTATRYATTTTLDAPIDLLNPGRPWTFIASVAAADGSGRIPSGMVALSIDGRIFHYEAVGRDGRAAFTTSLAPGTHVVTAEFLQGAGATASRASRVVLANDPPLPVRYETSTRLSSTYDPAPALTGWRFSLIAQVAGSIQPRSGLVRFYLGATLLGEVPIDETGRASLNARFDAPGEYLLTAVYLGDATFRGSLSPDFRQRVERASTSASAPTMLASHAGVVNLPAPFPISSPPSASECPSDAVSVAPPPSRRERLLAAARERQAARAAARAEALATLARRRPPAMRAGR